ncbi:MAG: signal peptidase I [Hymenobacter sp.]|nr:MAG: signal peptidase I [Hymenobacter sp.]
MDNQSSGIMAGVGGLFYMVLFVLIYAGLWKLFVKAGKPGWACLVPIYNIIVMHEIIGREGWKILLYLVPLVNIYFFITLYVSFAKSYGKTGIGNYLLLIFFSFIMIPLWGFSEEVRYVGPSEGPGTVPNNFGATPSTY